MFNFCLVFGVICWWNYKVSNCYILSSIQLVIIDRNWMVVHSLHKHGVFWFRMDMDVKTTGGNQQIPVVGVDPLFLTKGKILIWDRWLRMIWQVNLFFEQLIQYQSIFFPCRSFVQSHYVYLVSGWRGIIPWNKPKSHIEPQYCRWFRFCSRHVGSVYEGAYVQSGVSPNNLLLLLGIEK